MKLEKESEQKVPYAWNSDKDDALQCRLAHESRFVNRCRQIQRSLARLLGLDGGPRHEPVEMPHSGGTVR